MSSLFSLHSSPFFAAESAKLEHLSAVALAEVEAIKANLEGIGYGE